MVDKDFKWLSRECSGRWVGSVDCNGDCGGNDGICARACSADQDCGAFVTDADTSCDLYESCYIAEMTEYSDFDAYGCTENCPAGTPDYQMYRNYFFVCGSDGLLETHSIRGCNFDDSQELCSFRQCAERCRDDSRCNEFVVNEDYSECSLYTDCTYGDDDYEFGGNGEYRGEMLEKRGSASDSDEDGDSSESEGDRSDEDDDDEGPWSPQDGCVREYRDTSIAPQTRGPTSKETYTFEKKFDDINDCFRECPDHYIVYGEESGDCYCWQEESCRPEGFCDGSDCPGGGGGKWESEDGWVVYDQTECNGKSCDGPDEDSAISDSKEDSSDSEEDRSNDNDSDEGPWSPQDGCVREYRDTSIAPQTRGPTSKETYTFEKKFDNINDCFQECPDHYIVYGEESGDCYCWQEESCRPEGFCAGSDCPGGGGGKWESEDGWVVYDQTECNGKSCDGPDEDSDRQESSDS